MLYMQVWIPNTVSNIPYIDTVGFLHLFPNMTPFFGPIFFKLIPKYHAVASYLYDFFHPWPLGIF